MQTKTAAELVTAVIMIAAVCAVFILMEPPEDEGEDDVYIVHTGDTDVRSGDLDFDNAAALRDSLGGKAFLFDAGDALMGSGMNTMTQGDATVQIMNAARYDAVCVGPHDFSYMPDVLLERAGSMGCPVLCANLVWTATGETVFGDYSIIEKSGTKLGVFGLISPDMRDVTKPAHIKDMTIRDPADTAAKMVEALKGEGVDFIVALGSLGPDHSERYSAESVAAKVGGIDVFIEGYYGASDGRSVFVGDTLVTSVGHGFEEIGVVKVTGGTEASLVSSFTGRDPATSGAIAEQEARCQGYLDRVVGHTQVELYGGDRASFVSEVTLGDFAADALRQRSGADIAFFNGGFIRDSIRPGDVTVGMVCDAFPFDNYAVCMEVRGSVVLDMIEWSLRSHPAENGCFPQFSGMEIVWDPDAEPLHRVVSVTVTGQPLDAGRTYTLATTEFVADGGDGFSMLSGIPLKEEYEVFYIVVAGYISHLGDVTSVDTGRLATV